MRLFGWLKPKQPSLSISGGSGATMEDAVVIEASSSSIGIGAEYECVRAVCGEEGVDWERGNQALIQGEGGKSYDILTVRLKDGSEREFYFDITGFFGKW